MKLSILFLLLFYTGILPVYSQITDQFTDGNFTENPVWQGNTTHFIVNTNQQLQLNAPEAGAASLWTQGNIPDSCIWSVKVRLAFAPSSGNLLRIWLQAASPDLFADGYYLEIGENGSNDALKLYKQQGGVAFLLATGTPGAVASDPVEVTLKVKRNALGNWQTWLNEIPQFSLTNNDLHGGGALWFGFHCVYSATRTDKFFFDDMDIQPDIPDQIAPVLQSADNVGTQSVRLIFNEPIDSASAVPTLHYWLNGGEQPSSAQWSANQPAAVLLHFSAPWQNGTTYTLWADGIRDWSGNTAGTQSATFTPVITTPADPYDIVINEIMADPSPTVGLPAAAEWIELYNRSNKLIQLSELNIQDAGGTPHTLPDYLLPAGAWLVLCTPASAPALLQLSIPLLAMADFPSLNNESESLLLSNSDGTTIDRVQFDLSWHTDINKKEGGWSLERVNPDLVCLGKDNWKSCPQLPGGSPGRQNYAFNPAGDTTAPIVLTAVTLDAHHIRLDLTEGMDAGANQSFFYQFQPAVAVTEALLSDNRTSVQLTLQEAMQGGTLYQIILSPSLTDCSGNSVRGDSIFVGLPEVPEAGDLVINEILFNPASGGSRFVEIYNRSNKIIRWDGCLLAASETGGGAQPLTHDRMLIPGDYAVFTPGPDDIRQRFTGVRPDKLLLQPLPPIDDRSGNLALIWSNGVETVLLDVVSYSGEMHNALLGASEEEGTSLERIRTDGPSNSPANWTSSAWHGTPTLPNSQLRTTTGTSDDEIVLGSATLSPDGDGYEDYLDIRYALPGAGYAATITIFDSNGTPVKHLVRQELTGISGNLRWDGDRDDGSAARPGIYILWVQIWQPEGNTKEYTIPLALTTRW